jgi:hypothetical protein
MLLAVLIAAPATAALKILVDPRNARNFSRVFSESAYRTGYDADFSGCCVVATYFHNRTPVSTLSYERFDQIAGKYAGPSETVKRAPNHNAAQSRCDTGGC